MQDQFKDNHIQKYHLLSEGIFLLVAETSEMIHENIREDSVNEFCNLYLLQVKMPQ